MRSCSWWRSRSRSRLVPLGVVVLLASACASGASRANGRPASSGTTTGAPAAARQLSLADETRATLAELDTSHETTALAPMAARLRATGAFTVDLVESAPGRGNLVARYQGNGAKRPLLLLAHVDVV